MIDLKYSLAIEAAKDHDFFCFYSTELEGFSGVGNSVEDCLSRIRHMKRGKGWTKLLEDLIIHGKETI
jgi:predicted RNase H-like HicB family nuclease